MHTTAYTVPLTPLRRVPSILTLGATVVRVTAATKIAATR